MAAYYQHILWDWNGTLLDDRDLALHIVNTMLSKRKLAPITMDTYLQLFDHPVMDFYRLIGLGPEVMTPAEIAGEFQAGYAAGWPACQLQLGAMSALQLWEQLGIGQSVLSASHQQALRRLGDHFGISGYMDALLGLNDHYAHSKVQLGQEWLAGKQLQPAQGLMIGDTTHDFEVASCLGCDCLLVARGHQSEGKLAGCGVPVLNDLTQLTDSCQNGGWKERYLGMNR